ncbi:hypothetical protein ACUYOF_23100 [Photobacterium ganghwense]
MAHTAVSEPELGREAGLVEATLGEPDECHDHFGLFGVSEMIK